MTARSLLVGVILGCLGTAVQADDIPSVADLYEAKTKTVPLGKGKSLAMPYRLMKPKTIEDKKRYPLVLYLHGAGDAATTTRNNSASCRFGWPATRTARNIPASCWLPSAPKTKLWASTGSKSDPLREPGKPSEPMQAVLAILDEVVKRNPIDKQRVYVTGISLGGRGTWELAQRMPEKFAAVAPICNGGYEKYAVRLVGVPVWAWHGDADDVIPVERSRGMIAAIEKAGGKPKYTELKGVGHDSWTAAYTGPTICSPGCSSKSNRAASRRPPRTKPADLGRRNRRAAAVAILVRPAGPLMRLLWAVQRSYEGEKRMQPGDDRPII